MITEGTVADCTKAIDLINGFAANHLLADRAYDTREIIEYAENNGIGRVIPPKKNRLNQRDCDWALYKLRHLVENAFLSIKRWRGLATRYAKNASSFLAAVQIRCLMMWLNIS
jgi:transposase